MMTIPVEQIARPSTKRSPSILVTDVRSQGSLRRSSLPSPVESKLARRFQLQCDEYATESAQCIPSVPPLPQQAHGYSQDEINDFKKISINTTFPDASETSRAHLHGELRSSETDISCLQSPLDYGRKLPRAPATLLQSIPARTTKLSEKLVLIPEDTKPNGFRFVDDEDMLGPPLPYEDSEEQAENKRTFAERLPKDRRADRYSRVTAYCISDGIRLVAVASFLRKSHQILPRLYNEALYAPYSLPLLPGDDDVRVKSNTGETHVLERFIDQSEMVDHHFEYYSGLETGKDHSEGVYSDGKRAVEGHWIPKTSDFNPSEPQLFSPTEERVHAFHEIHRSDASEPISLRRFFKEEMGSMASTTSSSPMNTYSSQFGKSPGTDESASFQSLPDSSKHAEVFIFSYGVIVFWNFTEQQEKDVLADLNFARVGEQSLIIRPISEQDIETEELHFMYWRDSIKPRIYNDMITLRSGDHMVKLALSHAISQSTKLSQFEARMDATMHDVRHVPKMLALTGRLGFKREEVLRISGRLFKLRVDVNLSSNVLDTPDFFWEDEPSLNPLYTAVREYLEIEQRILVLNERCKVFLDLTEIIADSIAEFNMSRITWIIIILIGMSLAVSTLEIAVRFEIMRTARHHIMDISNYF